jgi:hypothetical protein
MYSDDLWLKYTEISADIGKMIWERNAMSLPKMFVMNVADNYLKLKKKKKNQMVNLKQDIKA